MKLNEAIAQRLSAILKERGLSAYKLARMGGPSKQVLYSLLKCAYERVSIDVIFDIAVTLDMTLSEFFADPIFNEVTD